MKQMTLMFIVLTMSVSAFAKEIQVIDDAKFVAQDSSPYSQLCLAALESKDAFKAKALELGVSRREQKQVVCNGLSMYEFAEKHRADLREWSVANVQ